MATNSLGAGTTNLSVNVPEDMKHELEALAAASGMKLGPYVRRLLTEAIGHGVFFETIRHGGPPAKSSPRKGSTPR